MNAELFTKEFWRPVLIDHSYFDDKAREYADGSFTEVLRTALIKMVLPEFVDACAAHKEKLVSYIKMDWHDYLQNWTNYLRDRSGKMFFDIEKRTSCKNYQIEALSTANGINTIVQFICDEKAYIYKISLTLSFADRFFIIEKALSDFRSTKILLDSPQKLEDTIKELTNICQIISEIRDEFNEYCAIRNKSLDIYKKVILDCAQANQVEILVNWNKNLDQFSVTLDTPSVYGWKKIFVLDEFNGNDLKELCQQITQISNAIKYWRGEK